MALSAMVGCNSSTAPPAGNKTSTPSGAKSGDTGGATATKQDAKLGSTGSGWGNVTGRIVFDGPRPAAVPLSITKDPEVCGKHMLVDESLVVGQDGGVKNAVVYLRTTSKVEAPVHPDLASATEPKVVCDNKNCRFDPHITLVWAGKQNVEFVNSDPVGHNVNVTALKNGSANSLIPPNDKFDFPVTTSENTPAPVACNIHPWMKGYLIIRDTPYMAASDESGAFELKNVPEGTWEFQFWQEKAGYLGVPGADKQGRMIVEVKAGQTTDLGKLSVKPEAFE